MARTLKRPSIGRILSSVRPAARAGPLPVQTGFPTSLADLVVKNHDRLRMTRKPQRRPSAVEDPVAAGSPVHPAWSELSPPVQQEDATVIRPPKGGAFFRLCPELLGLGGAVALSLLAVWSKGLVVVFTVASLSLLWIESIRSASRRPETGELLDLCGRGTVSPIRELVEPEIETPRSSCGDSDEGSGESPSPLWTAELAADGDDATNPKRKGKRFLRKLISRKLHKRPKAKDSPRPSLDGELEQAVAGSDALPVETQILVASAEETPSESSADSSSSELVVVEGPGGKLPLEAFISVILAGLVAGKLPATALTVLCLVFSWATRRSPAGLRRNDGDDQSVRSL